MGICRMCRWGFRSIVRGSFCKGIFLGFLVIFFYVHINIPNSEDHKNPSVYRRKVPKIPDVESNSKMFIKNYSPNITIQQSKSMVDDWMEVAESDRALFLYSAYFDARKALPVIRLVVIMKKRTKIKECQIWTSSGKTQRVRAVSRTIRENWALKYSAAFITCNDLPDTMDDPIVKVAIVFPDAKTVEPKLDVIYYEKKYQKNSISVCVKPFHYEFNRAIWLVEFIEMHRILGVNKFFFYNHTVGVDVEKVLRYYIQNDIATVLPWSLPVISQKEIRTEGIFAALNDCNLRSLGSFQYTIMIDIDEFILPRLHNNYKDLLNSLGDNGAYIFQNVFYYLYWDNDTVASSEMYGTKESLGSKLYGSEDNGPYLLTVYKTTRLSKPHKHTQRSKYIAQPEHAIECGNHAVWEFAGSKKALKVKPTDGLSHHYRICEFGGFDCLKGPHEIDRTAHNWLTPLFHGVAYSCSQIFPDTGVCPKAPPLGSPW